MSAGLFGPLSLVGVCLLYGVAQEIRVVRIKRSRDAMFNICEQMADEHDAVLAHAEALQACLGRVEQAVTSKEPFPRPLPRGRCVPPRPSDGMAAFWKAAFRQPDGEAAR